VHVRSGVCGIGKRVFYKWIRDDIYIEEIREKKKEKSYTKRA